MREIFENALTSWDKYWDGSFYPYLLLGAALYLLLFERKRKKAGYLLGYLGITLFLFFCPLTSALIQKCIGVWSTGGLSGFFRQFRSWHVLLQGWQERSGMQDFDHSGSIMSDTGDFLRYQCLAGGNYVKVANRQKVPERQTGSRGDLPGREVREQSGCGR